MNITCFNNCETADGEIWVRSKKENNSQEKVTDLGFQAQCCIISEHEEQIVIKDKFDQTVKHGYLHEEIIVWSPGGEVWKRDSRNKHRLKTNVTLLTLLLQDCISKPEYSVL